MKLLLFFLSFYFSFESVTSYISFSQTSGVNYELISKQIESQMTLYDYDDGSVAPLLLRLAWHSSGTYNKYTHNGGSCAGATMRFSPESADPANAGLLLARQILDPIKTLHPEISYSDLWILAGITAIRTMGGPKIPFNFGRRDAINGSACPPVGRLPDATQGSNYIRALFSRMGFDDVETVALIGAHSVGRMHMNTSGWSGKWDNNPLKFNNAFYRVLVNRHWQPHLQPNGKVAWKDSSKELTMLPSDMALLQDERYRILVHRFAENEAEWFQEFSKAFIKLTTNGCPAAMLMTSAHKHGHH